MSAARCPFGDLLVTDRDANARAVVAEGVVEGIRRAPLGYALMILALAIAFLLWELLSDAKVERKETAAYIQALHAELLQCHREKNH